MVGGILVMLGIGMDEEPPKGDDSGGPMEDPPRGIDGGAPPTNLPLPDIDCPMGMDGGGPEARHFGFLFPNLRASRGAKNRNCFPLMELSVTQKKKNPPCHNSWPMFEPVKGMDGGGPMFEPVKGMDGGGPMFELAKGMDGGGPMFEPGEGHGRRRPHVRAGERHGWRRSAHDRNRKFDPKRLSSKHMTNRPLETRTPGETCWLDGGLVTSLFGHLARDVVRLWWSCVDVVVLRCPVLEICSRRVCHGSCVL